MAVRGTYLRPLLVSRLGPAAACVLALWPLWAEDLPGGGVIRLAGSAVLLWVAVRCLRLGVVVASTQVEVKGYLWSRRIPRRAVTEVTKLPAVRWRDDRGRRRWTPVLSLVQTSSALPSINADHGSRASRLRRLLTGRA